MSQPVQAQDRSQNGDLDPGTSQSASNQNGTISQEAIPINNEIEIVDNSPLDENTRSRKRRRTDWKEFKIPKRDQATSRSRDASDGASDSSVSSDDSSHSESSNSESSSDDDSSNNDDSSSESETERKKKNKKKSKKKIRNSHEVSRDSRNDTRTNMAAPYTRFLPSTKKVSTTIERDMLEYASSLFNNYEKDSVLEDTILADNPVQEGFVVPNLDEVWQDMVEEGKCAPVKATEAALKRIQTRIINVMGPLSKMWATMETVRKNGGEAVDFHAFLTQIEQSICLLGQANVATLYHRRINILSKIMRNQKKAQKFLKKNTKRLSTKKLFGKKFYTKLNKSSQIKKQRRFLEMQFSTHKKPKFSYEGPQFQPFHGRPSSRSRGGGRFDSPQFPQQRRFNRGQGAYRGRGQKSTYPSTSANQTKRYVHFITSSDFKAKYAPNNSEIHSLADSKSKSREHSDHRNGGENKTLCGQLAKNHKRSKHHSNSSGLSNRVLCPSDAKHSRQTTKSIKSRGHGNVGRDNKNVTKQSHQKSSMGRSPVHEHSICDKKEDRGIQARVQREEAECIGDISPLQNGGHCDNNRDDQDKRLHDKNGPERRLLQCPNPRTTQTLPEFSMAQSNLPISVPSLRVSVSSPGIYKIAETSYLLPKENRHEGVNLFRRPNDSSSNYRGTSERHELGNRTPSEIRVCYQLEEIHAHTIPKTRISRVSNQLTTDDTRIAVRQDPENNNPVQGHGQPDTHVRQAVGQINRKADSIHYGHPPSSTPLQETATVTEPDSIGERSLRLDDSNNTRMQRRTKVVDRSPPHLEREIIYKQRPGPDHHHRLIPIRMGSRLPESKSRRSLEFSRTAESHKRARANSGMVGLTDICETEKQHSCSLSDGQYDSGRIHLQERGDKVTTTSNSSEEHVGLLLIETNSSHSRISTWQREHSGGWGIQELSGCQQLDAEENFLSADQSPIRPTDDRSFRRQAELPIDNLCQLATRPTLLPGGCLFNAVERSSSIRLSPVLSDREVLSQSQQRKSNHCADSTNLAKSSLVPSPDEHASRRPNSDTSMSRPTDISVGDQSPISPRRQNDISGMESVRQRYRAAGISQTAANLLSKSTRSGTRQTYNSSWKKWSSWCLEREVNPSDATLADMINFLSDMYDLGYSYNTINCFRSAISKIHPIINGKPVGQSEVIKETMTAIFNERTPCPKYSETWDVKTVIDYIASVGPNTSLPDIMLTHKLAMLLALTNASRASELHLINPEFIQDLGDKVVITITKPTKTRKVGSQPNKLTLTHFEQDELNPILALRTYLERTKTWRSSLSQKQQLFLGCSAPHKPVVTCTISNWLKKLMSKAGVDTDKFQAHSTRAAATSKAKTQGLSVEEIIICANWSNANTFNKFDHKHINESEGIFAQKVLRR